MRLLVVVVWVGLIGVGCEGGNETKSSEGATGSTSRPTSKLNWQIEAPADKRAAVVRALAVFERSCRAGFAANADWARARYATTNAVKNEDGSVSPGEFMLEELGWPDYVEVQIKLRSGAQGIFRGGDEHVLWFWLGSGAKPGVRVSTKKWALAACGVSPSDGADAVKPIPTLGGVLGRAPDWWATWAERTDTIAFPERPTSPLKLLGRKPAVSRRLMGKESPNSTGLVGGASRGSTLYLKWEPKGLEIDVTYTDDVAMEVSFVFEEMDRLEHRTAELSEWLGFDVKARPCVKGRRADVRVGANSVDVTWSDERCSG